MTPYVHENIIVISKPMKTASSILLITFNFSDKKISPFFLQVIANTLWTEKHIIIQLFLWIIPHIP
jgi:hypothetical protein